MTVSSCPHAWLEPLRVLFTDIGLASEEYSRGYRKTSCHVMPMLRGFSIVFTSKTAKSPSIDEATGLREYSVSRGKETRI
jgi:hypothetical protein